MRTDWSGFGFLVLAILALGTGSAAGSRYPDEPVAYYFDLTGEGEPKPTILRLKLPPKVWQHGDHPPSWAPGTSVRKGWGSAWWYIDDHRAAGTAAHAYLEIEPLNGRKLKDAVEEAIKDLADVYAAAKHRLRSPPAKPTRYKKLKLGGKRVKAYTITYTVSPPAIHSPAGFRSEALFFALRGHFVTLAVDNMGGNDFFALFVKGLGLAKTREGAKDYPFKLFFVEAGVSRFLTLHVPAGFLRRYRAEEGDHAALWERRGPDGNLRARLAVTESWAHRMPLAEVMRRREPALRSRYESLEGPTAISVSDRPAWQVAYRDLGDGTPRSVRKVYIRLRNQDYALCWETLGDDPKQIDEDAKLFAKVLGGVRVWRSRVE